MKRSERLLQPSQELSIFKVKVYYTFQHHYRVGMDGENSFFSFDYEAERENPPKKYTHEEMMKYNGYRQMLIFIEKLAIQGKLKRALIYANLQFDRPLVDTITVTPGVIKQSQQVA